MKNLVTNILLDNNFPLNVNFNKINKRLKKLFNYKLNSNTIKQSNDNNKSVEYIEKIHTYLFRI